MSDPKYRIDHYGWGHWTARPAGYGAAGGEWFIWAPTRWLVLWRLPRAIRRNEHLRAETEHVEASA